MTDFTFLPSDTAEAKHDIVQALYDRLNDVRRAMNVRPSIDDEFEMGIDCRLANESEWLENLLEVIERS
jgi:hypothetical protein